MNGVINILKPPNMTSHDVVAVARRALKMKKIGHTGTLDPMAAGVLPICVGKATKIIEFLIEDSKTYRCEMTLGSSTDTQDMWGEVLTSSELIPDEEAVREAVMSFVGDIYQVPPMYSALKVNGKKLYELARAGIEVEREARLRTIFTLDIISIQGNKVLFDVQCSKGTYIRTLCHDIGLKLGCGAHMSFLLRIQSGQFTIENAITVEDLRQKRFKMINIDQAIEIKGKIHIDPSISKQVRNGVKLNLAEYVSTEPEDGDKRFLVYEKDEFLGIAERLDDKENVIKMAKMFI